MTDIFTGRVKPDLIRDRIVVGMTAASVNDTLTSAVKGTLLTAALCNQESLDQYKLIYGVEMRPTCQIVNAVLNGRPLLHIWSGLGICLDSGLGSRDCPGIDSSIPWKQLLSIGCMLGGFWAADLELVGSSRTGVTGFAVQD